MENHTKESTDIANHQRRPDQSDDVNSSSVHQLNLLEKPKTMAELLDILDTLRTPHVSFAGKHRTFRSVRLFTAIYALILLLVSATSSYFFTVSDDVQRRFQFPDYEMKFIHGADKLTAVFTTLFVGYFGNRMHKPFALFALSLVFAFGTILMAVPYWTRGENENSSAENLQTFAEAGVCFHGLAIPGQNVSDADDRPTSAQHVQGRLPGRES